MRRSSVRLEDVACWKNLTRAFCDARRGKRDRPDVRRFSAALDAEFRSIIDELLSARWEPRPLRSFTIHDPKIRLIQAPEFRDRVVHHALMAVMGPVLERSLIADTYACRVGKGTTAAIDRTHRHLRALPWYAKLDIRSYFASIDHAKLIAQLARRFKDERLIELCARIIAKCATAPGRGLPIGALPSQHFANQYLGDFDRAMTERVRVAGYVRYVDDVVLWCHSKDEASQALRAADEFCRSHLSLSIHRQRVQRCSQGLAFLGVRMRGSVRRPTLRRARRYRSARQRWERAYLSGVIDSATLQRCIDSTLAILDGCASVGVRRRDLLTRPPIEA